MLREKNHKKIHESFLEAVSVQRDQALLAHQQGLRVGLFLQSTQLAVAPFGLPCHVQLRADDPVLPPVVPGIRHRTTQAGSFPNKI